MARGDYAARNKRPAKKPAGLPGWLWMIVGLSLGLAVAVFVYISRPADQPLRGTSASMQVGEGEAASELVNGKKLTPSQARDINDKRARAEKNAKAEKGGKSDAVTVPPKEKSRFTFYELLPSQEVLVPSQPEAAATKQAPGATPPPAAPAVPAQPGAESGSFIIQVASYRNEAEANKQKAALALLGVESRVEKVTIDNKDTFYRVRVGPQNEAKARSTMALLEQNGVNAMMVRVR